jgi:hypothetical protein
MKMVLVVGLVSVDGQILLGGLTVFFIHESMGRGD